MAKPFTADIRIVEGGGLISPGPGFANAEGLAAKTAGFVPWSHLAEIRRVDTRAGGATAGAVAGGGVGLIGGPPVAAAGAVIGAVASTIAGAKHLYALRHFSGADLLVELPMLKGGGFEKAYRTGRAAGPPPVPVAPVPEAAPLRQRLTRLLTGRTKGEA